MKKNKEYHMNIGGASIILLLVVFSLSIFAVLSIRSSYHELKLAQKTQEAVEAYYNADTRAEVIYNNIQNVISDLQAQGVQKPAMDVIASQPEISDDVYYDVFSDYLTYSVSLDYNKDINVCLSVDYSQNDVSNLKIISWRVINLSDDVFDSNEVDLWDGIVTE